MPSFPDLPFAVRLATYFWARGDPARALAARVFVASGDSETPASDRAIARLCKVTHPTVADWRRDWRKAFDAACEWERQSGRDLAAQLAQAYGLELAPTPSDDLTPGRERPSDSPNAGGLQEPGPL